MSGQSKMYSVEIADEKLRSALDDAENRSGMLREALRKLIEADAPNKMQDLEDVHKTAYHWLEDRGLVLLDEAETSIAVQAQLDKQVVRISALEPLRQMGLLKIHQAMDQVRVQAIPPVECFGCGQEVPPNQIGSHIDKEHIAGSDD